MNILAFLLVGLIAGWLAGFLMGGPVFGILGSIVLGVLGAFVGGFVLDALDVVILTGSTFLNAVITSTLGAAVILLVARLLSPRRRLA